VALRASWLWGLVAFAIAGCATMRNVEVGSESSVRPALKEGDRIELTTRDDRHYQLTVVGVSEVAIEGKDREGESVSIPFEDIVELQVREPRPGRTAALAAGGAIGAVTIFYMVLAAVAVGAIVGGF
jgi:hypothetical protein